MNILLTGATGYIGKRLLPVLLQQGYFVVCCVRDKSRLEIPLSFKDQVQIIEVDFLDLSTLDKIPNNIEVAYYLMHSMSSSEGYDEMELKSAKNFKESIQNTSIMHVIYLSGIVNEKNLSKHLSSRKAVELELSLGEYNFTALRAGIIIGSGSASFEIIRDLVEKLPVMIAPRWLNTKCQPIAIRDVIEFLSKTILNKETYNKSFDIGGADILTYKEMLKVYAEIRKLNRWIYTVPVMTPKLSSYWLFFITSTSYKLASALVNSMKVEVVCRDNQINKILDVSPMNYKKAIQRTLSAVENNLILSSWKDSLISGQLDSKFSEFINVPSNGCFHDMRKQNIENTNRTMDKIWQIGGNNGWYYANFLWEIRGFIDLLLGGVGLRRGRTHPSEITIGGAIDFWRVLYANKDEKRLLLFAEMKLPGEAWLEFKIVNNVLYQTATFRPKGLFGRLYWVFVYPLHGIIFNGLIKKLTK
ncbi:MAG: SDR family oxidoreductase [Bacteroidales bacterium]|nr:SDR family oxidoreductase [Bacteroidales bacterium]